MRGYSGVDPPKLDGPNACPHCHLSPLCDSQSSQLVEGLRSSKPWQRASKRWTLYTKFCRLLSHLGVFSHPEYIDFKITKTSILDCRDPMLDCVVRVSIVCFEIVTTYSIMCNPFRMCVADSQIQPGNPICYLSGPPLPPEPVLVINSSSQLDVHWEIPYSNELYPVENYGILILNISSGNVLDSVLNFNGTTYVYTFEDNVEYCQVLTVNVTAVSALGLSAPGSASRGFPIGKIRTSSVCNIYNCPDII